LGSGFLDDVPASCSEILSDGKYSNDVYNLFTFICSHFLYLIGVLSFFVYLVSIDTLIVISGAEDCIRTSVTL